MRKNPMKKKGSSSKKRKTKKPGATPNTLVGIIFTLASSAKNKAVKARRLKIKRDALNNEIRKLDQVARKDLAVCQALEKIMNAPDKKEHVLNGLPKEERERARQLLKRVQS